MRVISPDLTLELSPARLKALVLTFGGAGTSMKSPSPAKIAKLLFEKGAPPRLARALSDVGRFGTDNGLRAIVEAARAAGDGRADAWLDERGVDVAAELVVLRAAGKGAVKRVARQILALATLRLERRLPDCPTYELLVDAPGALSPAAVKKALGKALGPTLFDVWMHPADDGRVHFAVFVVAPRATSLVAGSGAGALAVHAARSIVVDLLVVAADGARVRVTTSAPELLPRYSAALGLSARPSFTLRPFHELPPPGLAYDKLPSGVRAAVVVGRRRRRPNGARTETRSFDVSKEEGPMGEGYVDRVTLRVDLADADRPVDAFLELPWRFDVSDRAYEAPIRALLHGAGVFAPGVLADDAWTLAPFVHGEWRWVSVLGKEHVDRMRQAGLLVKEKAPHATTEELRMLGSTYVVRDVPGEPGLAYALSEDPSVPARLVREEHRVAYRLVIEKLADALRSALGSSGGGANVGDAVLDLGWVAIGAGKMRFFYLVSQPGKGWAAAIARACGLGATPVVLVPRGRREAVKEMAVVELDVTEQLGADSAWQVVARAARALGAEGELEAWRIAEEELVVDKASQRVWFRGVLVTKLSEKSYRFVVFLAENQGKVVATKELGALVSMSGYPDVAARRTKREVERQVGESLVAAGRGAEAESVKRIVVVEGKKGYRLGVGARVV